MRMPLERRANAAAPRSQAPAHRSAPSVATSARSSGVSGSAHGVWKPLSLTSQWCRPPLASCHRYVRLEGARLPNSAGERACAYWYARAAPTERVVCESRAKRAVRRGITGEP
jgi:hypothetical protein